MVLDPLSRPNIERVIPMDGFIHKRAQTDKQDNPDHDPGMRRNPGLLQIHRLGCCVHQTPETLWAGQTICNL